MLSDQSLMPGGAGTLRYENGCPSLEAFGCQLCHPSTSPGFPPRIGVRGRLFAGMTNSGGPELRPGTVNLHGGFCDAPRRPQRGTSPRATFSHSAIDHRSAIRQGSPVESRHRG